VIDDEPGFASRPSPAIALSRSTSYLLIKLGELVKIAGRDTLVPLGLRPRHLDVLAALAALPSPSQQTISATLGLDPNTVVDVVDDLERMGYTVRERNPRDRRQHLLVATPAGHEILSRAATAAGEAEANLLAVLSPEQRTALHEAAGILLAQLRSDTGRQPPTAPATQPPAEGLNGER
jgi:DNA-binding MarR family transcriptional regulator